MKKQSKERPRSATNLFLIGQKVSLVGIIGLLLAWRLVSPSPGIFMKREANFLLLGLIEKSLAGRQHSSLALDGDAMAHDLEESMV
jgi:hypothetical protein